MTDSTNSKFDKPQEEPLFVAVSRDDPELLAAYALAASTLSHFRNHVSRPGKHFCCAKLRFKDPDQSEELGEDRFCFLWLSSVHYHQTESLYSGTFFEVPPGVSGERHARRVFLVPDHFGAKVAVVPRSHLFE